MTGNEALEALLTRIADTLHGIAYVSEEELSRWPRHAVASLTVAGLLRPASPAASATCDGCQRRCHMPVEVLDYSGETAAFIFCDKPVDIGRVEVPLNRLVRWQSSGEALAAVLAMTLGITRSPGVASQANRWDVGLFRGKRAVPLVLRKAKVLTLELAGHAVPMIEVLTLKGGRLEMRRERLIGCVDQPIPGGVGQESPAQRRERLEAEIESKRAHGVPAPISATAASEGISRQMLNKIRRGRKARTSTLT